jgi:hypothetical protein
MNRSRSTSCLLGLFALLVAGLGTLDGCAAPTDDASSDDATGVDNEAVGTSEEALGLSANLLSNGFFESAIYKWDDPNPSHGIFGHWRGDNRYAYPMVTDPHASLTRTTAAAWGGTYGVRATADGAGSWANLGQYTPNKLAGGAQYRLWVIARRRSGPGEQCVQVSFVGPSGLLTMTFDRVGTGSSWHAVTKTVRAPKDADHAYVGLGKCAASDPASVYDWDSVSFRKVL